MEGVTVSSGGQAHGRDWSGSRGKNDELSGGPEVTYLLDVSVEMPRRQLDGSIQQADISRVCTQMWV